MRVRVRVRMRVRVRVRVRHRKRQVAVGAGVAEALGHLLAQQQLLARRGLRVLGTRLRKREPVHRAAREDGGKAREWADVGRKRPADRGREVADKTCLISPLRQGIIHQRASPSHQRRRCQPASSLPSLSWPGVSKWPLPEAQPGVARHVVGS